MDMPMAMFDPAGIFYFENLAHKHEEKKKLQHINDAANIKLNNLN